MPLSPGTRLGPYEILAALGAGGMGEVYRARDTRLGREVAVKVLPAAFSAHPEWLRRFEQEARTTGLLNHPNILAIYDIGTHEGCPYVVSELLEGETLRQRMAGAALPPRKAVDYALQTAHGLAAAHEKGVVHRDLKPENLFVTKDGHVKILDFGLAKLSPVAAPSRAASATDSEETEAPSTPPDTQPGAVLGTVGYMSPEQVRGRSSDHRSDIFSFGAVLYEMLSGQRAFRGGSVVETMSAILKEDPPELTGMQRHVPPALERVVRRCLEKSPEERFQSARDLGFALEDAAAATASAPSSVTAAPVPAHSRRWLALALAGFAALLLVAGYALLSRRGPPAERPAPATATAPKKIVVLPFENLGAAEDEYFASGITDEITSRLAVVRGLGVISRTSALQYKKAAKTAKQIGAELGVDYVLEGTVRWERSAEGKSRVRVTPQLIRVSDDTHVWAGRYDRVMDEIFQVQSEIAEQVIAQLDVALLQPERTAMTARPTENLDAYQAYLRGKDYLWRPPDEENSRNAVRMLERAVELDPKFALAHAELSRAHSYLYHFGHDRTDKRLASAREAVDRALALQPDLPAAHVALGYYHYWGQRDYDRALAELAIAAKGLPNDTDILAGTAFIRRRQGKLEEALSYLQKAMALDPQNARIVINICLTHLILRRYAEAERACDRAISLAPDQVFAYTYKAYCELESKGATESARAILNKMPESNESLAVDAWLALDILERNYQKALDRISSLSAQGLVSQDAYSPKALLSAQVYRFMNQPQLARASFDSARVLLEKEARERPEDYRIRSALGLVYAGLGRKQDAIREGKRAVELYPVSKDAFVGPERVLALARIYVMVGEYEAALDQIEYLLSIPSTLSVPLLRLDPMWDPLRDHPRFRKLVTP